MIWSWFLSIQYSFFNIAWNMYSCSHPLSLNHNRSFGPEQDFHTQLQDRFVCKCVNLHKKVGKPVTCCCQGHNYWHRFSRTWEHSLQSTSTLKTSWVVVMSLWKINFNNTLCFLNKPKVWQWSISYHFPIMVQGEIICWSSKRKRSHPQRKSVWCSEKWQGRTIYLQRRRKGDFPTCQGPWIWRL